MGRRSGVFKPPKAHIVARDRHNNVKKELKQEKTIRRLLKKHKKKSELLKSLGVDLKMNKLVSDDMFENIFYYFDKFIEYC